MIFGVAQSVKTRISSKRMGFGRISINPTGRQSKKKINRESIQQVDSLSGQSGSLLAIVYRLHCKSTHMSFIRLFGWV